MIKGEKVILIEYADSGEVDDFNRPISNQIPIEIDNVLIGQPTFESVSNDLNILGKKLAFVLGIPKGDTHNWKDAEVIIRGQRFRTYGFPMTQTSDNVPGAWNTQVKVEVYE